MIFLNALFIISFSASADVENSRARIFTSATGNLHIKLPKDKALVVEEGPDVITDGLGNTLRRIRKEAENDRQCTTELDSKIVDLLEKVATSQAASVNAGTLLAATFKCSHKNFKDACLPTSEDNSATVYIIGQDTDLALDVDGVYECVYRDAKNATPYRAPLTLLRENKGTAHGNCDMPRYHQDKISKATWYTTLTVEVSGKALPFYGEGSGPIITFKAKSPIIMKPKSIPDLWYPPSVSSKQLAVSFLVADADYALLYSGITHQCTSSLEQGLEIVKTEFGKSSQETLLRPLTVTMFGSGAVDAQVEIKCTITDLHGLSSDASFSINVVSSTASPTLLPTVSPKKYSCKEYFNIGERTNGMYTLYGRNQNGDEITYQQYCLFVENSKAGGQKLPDADKDSKLDGGWTRFFYLDPSCGSNKQLHQLSEVNRGNDASCHRNFIETQNGCWRWSGEAMRASDKLLMYVQNGSPWSKVVMDFRNYSPKQFEAMVTGDSRAGDPFYWSYQNKVWIQGTGGPCNHNDHSQFNCEPERGLRFHYPTRNCVNDGGSSPGTSWNSWFTGFSSNYYDSDLVSCNGVAASCGYSGSYSGSSWSIYYK